MKTKIILLLALLMISEEVFAQSAHRNSYYITNQAPLVATPYTALPLGAIQPKGWLLNMLELQKTGMTGHLDEIYSEVCGPRNAWLGGDGDCWE